MSKSNKSAQQVQRTVKAKYVEKQLTVEQKTQLMLLTKELIPNVKKFTMTTHLNVITTDENGVKTLRGHWYLFVMQELLRAALGSSYSIVHPVIDRSIQGENIIDLIVKYRKSAQLKAK